MSSPRPIDAYQNLVNLIQSADEDVRKAEGGNKAAGTRVRKTMQEVKKMAQELRQAILTARDDNP